uniref:Uncharacterized protein n=1 Tax=Acrobeloides nanus TaxID=290746 RepID=A0A914CL83_9BILA
MIGSSIGFSVVAQGLYSLEWDRIAKIAIGWIVAPLASGVLSAIIYIIIDFAILRRRKPLKHGLKLQPILYFFTISFMVLAVIFHGPSSIKIP